MCLFLVRCCGRFDGDFALVSPFVSLFLAVNCVSCALVVFCAVLFLLQVYDGVFMWGRFG